MQTVKAAGAVILIAFITACGASNKEAAPSGSTGTSTSTSTSIAAASTDFTATSAVELSDPTDLSTQYIAKSKDVQLNKSETLKVTQNGTAPTAGDVTLTLVGEVAAPSVNKITLGATGVVIRGDHAFVSYNARGATYSGAVQHIQLNDFTDPKVESQLLFTTRDINDVSVCGTRMYLAIASNSGASVGYIDLDGGKAIKSATLVETALEGYAANSVRCSSSTVIVTHGDNAGVSILDKDLTSSSRIYLALADARSVDFWQSANYAVLAGAAGGSGGSVWRVKKGTLDSSIAVGGATIAESKSRIEVVSDIAIAALNDGGVKIVNLSTGKSIAEVAAPVVSGFATSATVSNSASVYKDRLFIANGEAGVYMGVLDAAIDSNPTAVTIAGQLNFGDAISANDVRYRNNKLFVAAGTGGFKIVKVSGTPHDSQIQSGMAADANSTDDN